MGKRISVKHLRKQMTPEFLWCHTLISPGNIVHIITIEIEDSIFIIQQKACNKVRYLK